MVSRSVTVLLDCWHGWKPCRLSALNDIRNAPPAYVGTGQTMYLWGAMVESSSDASSYIPNDCGERDAQRG